jgi:hypothetical protein
MLARIDFEEREERLLYPLLDDDVEGSDKSGGDKLVIESSWDEE